MKKILVYAFKPFGENNKNTSEEILKRVEESEELRKQFLRTRFDQEIFLNLLNFKPDIILGLGQYPKGEKIRIERRAVNCYGSKNKEKYKKIDKEGSDYLEVNLEIKEDENSFISYNAGKFVCNFSMYILAKECRKRRIRYGFLHIPRNMDLGKAKNFVEKTIKISLLDVDF